MTGIPVPTIRMWERRYAVVCPVRSTGGARLYSEQDVARLSLLRQAAELGHAVGTVVSLSDDELRARLNAPSRVAMAPASRCRVAVIGETLRRRIQSVRTSLQGIEVIAALDSAAALKRALGAREADVVVADYPTLQPEQVCELRELLRDLQPRLLIVVYGFAAQRVLRRLDHDRVLALRAPTDVVQLLRVSLLGLNIVAPGVEGDGGSLQDWAHRPLAPRQLTDSQLARLAEIASAIRCECPQHLSDLLLSLGAFEHYSAQCESTSPEDAALHNVLRATAGRARHLLEEALLMVLRAENIDPHLM
jgi:DNA-binding transcriptional MerR regulator